MHAPATDRPHSPTTAADGRYPAAWGAAPSMTRIAVFPGQGAQAVGMGRALYECEPGRARRVRRGRRGAGRAALQPDLRGLARAADADRQCPAGPDGDLARRRARGRGAGRPQACRLWSATSPATAWASIRPWRPPARSRIGDAARLLRLRGQAMQDAVPAGEGAMAAILGADVPTVEAVVRRGRGRGRRLRARQRQWRGPAGDLRQRRRRRARGGRWPRSAAPAAASCCRSRHPSIAR